ncbi:MAG: mannose-1-phosphate guanylyltransferase [Candidatus Saccharimonadales bacterium]
MIVLIMAGGSGTRLWPLSTPDNPKHLLNVNNDSYSLLQRTYERAKLLSDNIFVITESSQVNSIMHQLPDLSEDNVLSEPGPRGTANCLIVALSKISQMFEPKETIASIHADHYIRDSAGFVNSFNLAKHIASRSKEIVLIGTEPDYPSTGFGYIEKGDLVAGQTFTYHVKSFKEKPDFETAKKYLQSGNYLWNCGYFVGEIGTFLDSMKKHAKELYKNYQKLAKVIETDYEDVYLKFNSLTIDYALIEKVPNLLVVPASFDWMDLGTFNDLSIAIGGNEQGNSLKGRIEIEEVQNSLLQNLEDKPMAVIGLDNIVAINTPEGILVVRKDLAQKVGEVSKRLKS